MANIIAVIWDCDKTLVDGYMQDPIFEEYKIDAKSFWVEVNALPKKYMDEQGVLVNPDTIYLNQFIKYAKEGRIICDVTINNYKAYADKTSTPVKSRTFKDLNFNGFTLDNPTRIVPTTVNQPTVDPKSVTADQFIYTESFQNAPDKANSFVDHYANFAVNNADKFVGGIGAFHINED